MSISKEISVFFGILLSLSSEVEYEEKKLCNLEARCLKAVQFHNVQ